MGTHPIFESDFDCLTDCFCSEKMLSRLARPAVVQVQKRKFNPIFFWGTLPLLEKIFVGSSLACVVYSIMSTTMGKPTPTLDGNKAEKKVLQGFCA